LLIAGEDRKILVKSKERTWLPSHSFDLNQLPVFAETTSPLPFPPPSCLKKSVA
jgi:hypothetical protein